MQLKHKSSKRKLGIIAGGGDLPLQAIRHCEKTERPFFVIALEGQALGSLVDQTIPHMWCRLGAVGKMMDTLKHEKVEDIVLIGSVKRPSFLDLRPDLYAAKLLARLGTKTLGDNDLLSFLVKEIESQGFCVQGIEDILPKEALLLPEGSLGINRPAENMWRDIHKGIEIARLLGTADVGQSVIMADGLCLGVEALEGTDALIKRCSILHKERVTSQEEGGVLIKLCKPDQELRVDLPTVGLTTLKNIKTAGFKGIIAEAQKTLLVDAEACRLFADKNDLFVFGIKSITQGKSF